MCREAINIKTVVVALQPHKPKTIIGPRAVGGSFSQCYTKKEFTKNRAHGRHKVYNLSRTAGDYQMDGKKTKNADARRLTNGILSSNTRQDNALWHRYFRLHVNDQRKLFLFTFMVR